MARSFEGKRRTSRGGGQHSTALHRLAPSPNRDLVLVTGSGANRGPLGSPTLGAGSVLQPALRAAVGGVAERLQAQQQEAAAAAAAAAADSSSSSSLREASSRLTHFELRLANDSANPGRLVISGASLTQFLRTCEHWGVGPAETTPLLLRDGFGGDEVQEGEVSMSAVHHSASSMRRLRQIQRLKSQLTQSYDPFRR